MSVDGEGSFVTDLSGEAGLKSFCSLISVSYQYYHFWGWAVNQIAEVICSANSFGGLYLSYDISKLGSGFCQIGATKTTSVCACTHVCIYTHQYKCIPEVMFAQRKYSVKVQDWPIMSILLSERGTGSNLLPEAKCRWLLQLVRVSSRSSNFTLETCSWSGANRTREWADNLGMWMIRSPVLGFTTWPFAGHSRISLCNEHTQLQRLALCFGPICLM